MKPSGTLGKKKRIYYRYRQRVVEGIQEISVYGTMDPKEFLLEFPNFLRLFSFSFWVCGSIRLFFVVRTDSCHTRYPLCRLLLFSLSFVNPAAWREMRETNTNSIICVKISLAEHSTLTLASVDFFLKFFSCRMECAHNRPQIESYYIPLQVQNSRY